MTTPIEEARLPGTVKCCGIRWILIDADESQPLTPGFGRTFNCRCGKCGTLLSFSDKEARERLS